MSYWKTIDGRHHWASVSQGGTYGYYTVKVWAYEYDADHIYKCVFDDLENALENAHSVVEHRDKDKEVRI